MSDGGKFRNPKQFTNSQNSKAQNVWSEFSTIVLLKMGQIYFGFVSCAVLGISNFLTF